MLTAIEVRSRAPLAGGAEFGASGAYERIEGTARGALDPAHPANRGIALIDRAPRNAVGLVEYATDFVLLRPVDPGRGNGRLLHETNNRGRIMMIHNLCGGTAGNDWTAAGELGNALPMRLGFSLLWNGWDAGAPKSTGLSLETPAIAGFERDIREEFVSATRRGVHDVFKLSFRAASRDAAVTVRRTQMAERRPVPFAFADDRTIALLPAGTLPEPGSIYEIRYRAAEPRVQGIGFAATRDLVSHLRRHGADLLGRAVTHTLAFGISQAGRYLRDHIAKGFNADEDGARVFDGVFTHVAGVGRVFHDTPFAQPFRTRTWHEDHGFPEIEFPFSAAAATDPGTGAVGALLRGDATDPLLFETNTPTEYWQKAASLLHTDPGGTRDLDLPANVRGYLIAGTQHGGRPGSPRDNGPCVLGRNWHDPSPALRALLVALDEWVAFGRKPPPSALPRIDDGSLVRAEALGFPAVSGLTPPAAANPAPRLDDWTRPAMSDAGWRPLVPAVDADGHERAGIRLPDIAAPRGTHTGWNRYAAPYPEGEIADRDGTFLPFAATAAEREAVGDPRASLAERYGSEERERAAWRAAAEALVARRLMLAEDAARF